MHGASWDVEQTVLVVIYHGTEHIFGIFEHQWKAQKHIHNLKIYL